MEDAFVQVILKEVRGEQTISPSNLDAPIVNFIKEGIYDIDSKVGWKIDYDIDLFARKLLKNYVFYARFGKLDEFKIRYEGDYVDLQQKYFLCQKEIS